MATFNIRMINSTFFTDVTVHNQPDADAALADAVRGALLIAADDVAGGAPAASVEIIVKDVAGQTLRRPAVSASAAALSAVPDQVRPPVR